MATPTETPTGAPESTAPGTEPQDAAGGAPDPHGTPALDPQGLPQTMADGVQVAGRTGGQPPVTPQTPAPSAESPSPQAEPVDSADSNARPEISSLPPWAQDLIKDTRAEVARSRVEAKKAAAEEAAAAATKKVTEDIGRALGLITDDTPEEQKLTPQELQTLLAGERTSTKMARTELAVFKAASGGTFNAAALLDSRSFLDSVKDLDPSDAEAVGKAIAAAVEANPWLKSGQAPAPVEEGGAAEKQGQTPGGAPAPVAQPPAPPSGGSFAGGPGAQPQDLSAMSIDDFRKLRQNTPRF